MKLFKKYWWVILIIIAISGYVYYKKKHQKRQKSITILQPIGVGTKRPEKQTIIKGLGTVLRNDELPVNNPYPSYISQR